jgi:hypothetical protein
MRLAQMVRCCIFLILIPLPQIKAWPQDLWYWEMIMAKCGLPKLWYIFRLYAVLTRKVSCHGQTQQQRKFSSFEILLIQLAHQGESLNILSVTSWHYCLARTKHKNASIQVVIALQVIPWCVIAFYYFPLGLHCRMLPNFGHYLIHFIQFHLPTS